jgi:hypothetical protein
MSIRSVLLADMIVEGLSAGTPMRQLCREIGISKSELYRWRDDDADFKGRLDQARDFGFDALAEQCLAIADGSSGEPVARSKLRIETRLKLLACWDPRRYGSKIDITANEPPYKPLTLAEYYAGARADLKTVEDSSAHML